MMARWNKAFFSLYVLFTCFVGSFTSAFNVPISTGRRAIQSGFSTTTPKVVLNRTPTYCFSTTSSLLMKNNEMDSTLNPFKALKNIFGGSKEENSIVERNQKQKSELDNAIDTILKDAPLPVKLAGGLIKGVVGMVGSMVAETQDDVAEVLAEAERAMRFDPQVESVLGTQVRCGSPFSQSYSSMNINGKISKQISLQVAVEGSKGSGTAAISATSDSAGNIILNQVSLGSSRGRVNVETRSYKSTSSKGSSDVVDVDVIE